MQRLLNSFCLVRYPAGTIGLAGRPPDLGAGPGQPPGTVLLRELVAQLARWAKPGTVVRPPFSQTAAGHGLMQLGWLGVLAALGLLWRGYLAVGALLLAVATVYLLRYYQARRQAGSSV